MDLRIAFLIATVTLAGCMADPPSYLSFINGTNIEMRVSSVQVNGRQVSSMLITVPPSTVEKSRSNASSSDVRLTDEAKVLAIVVQNESTVTASCVLPRRPDGVCVVYARFSGGESLHCGFDCYDSSASK